MAYYCLLKIYTEMDRFKTNGSAQTCASNQNIVIKNSLLHILL